MNINNGKTNGGEGHKLYGRSMRAADVSHCSVGAWGFYMLVRLELTGEFDDGKRPDFTEAPQWFEIKLLISLDNGATVNYKKPMANTSYDAGIRRTLKALSLASNHIVHIGRILGANELALAEVPEDDIRIYGNWSPSITDKSYSIKLPINSMRNMAGYANRAYFCLRSQLEPPQSLKDMIFPFASSELEKVEHAIRNPPPNKPANYCATAQAFLHLLVRMKTIILQDAAAMLIQCPDRVRHPMFSLAVFRDPRFMVRFQYFVDVALQTDNTNTHSYLTGIQGSYEATPSKSSGKDNYPTAAKSGARRQHEYRAIHCGLPPGHPE